MTARESVYPLARATDWHPHAATHRPISGALQIPTSPAKWREEWRTALARAASVNAIPSAYPLPVRSPRTAEVPARQVDVRRRAMLFETMP